MADGYNDQTMAMTGQRFEATPDPAVVEHALHNELKNFRISKRESQEKFWARFGVTQSSGSRFETGLGIPAPVAILVKLYVKGRLSDGDLQG
jgi:hypothetical protein